jgi:hypothetical protein
MQKLFPLTILFLSSCTVNPDNSVQVNDYNIRLTSQYSGCAESSIGFLITIALVLSIAASIKILFFNNERKK